MEYKRRILRRNKTIAGGLMVAAAILFVIARFHKGIGYWEWASAFSEAAMIGALADWFAVVALFRHPLGIPIPHTAIIPNKKNTIADSLAEFIRDKFLATESLINKMREFNPAQRISTFLSSEKNAVSVATGVGRILVDSLSFIDDSRVRKIIHAAINNRIEKLDLATTVAQVLDALRKEDRHQKVLDDVLRRLAVWLAIPESQEKIATAIDNWVNKEYPMLGRMIPNREQFMKGAGEKIANRLNIFIQEVNADPSHELRSKFNDTLNEFTEKLRNDDALRGKVESFKQEIIANPALTEYINSLWCDLKNWLQVDLNGQDSKIREKLASTAVGLGRTLSKSKDLKDSINDHLERMVRNYADNLRIGFARHISGTIQQWNDEDFVSEIELSIGSDLQFIRMNGTLVGGMIGLIIHAITLVLG
ncbi:MAG: DUF445 domain-containing protein [Geobacteraceae bacterium]|nr:DUF445 domain-containing protein [Geobacteraceae bacterium]